MFQKRYFQSDMKNPKNHDFQFQKAVKLVLLSHDLEFS